MKTLPSYSDALQKALDSVEASKETEIVSIKEALHQILAKEIIADRDFPPFHRAQMDGYAVVASEVSSGASMEVLAHVAAGDMIQEKIPSHTCVSIATVASVPDGFDAVVKHELTDCGTETVKFHCDEVNMGTSIHPEGADARAGEVLIESNTALTPQHLGIVASVGEDQLEVVTKPKVMLLTSGDEVVDVHAQPLPHQIRNGNSAVIEAAFSSMGCDVIEAKHLLDDAMLTENTIQEALDHQCDLVVTVGGISAGKKDYFPEAFAKAGVDFLVHGAQIQPGKPIIVGKHKNTTVLGLPGNPVSALVCSCIFGWPIVRKMLGFSSPLPWQTAPLAKPVMPNPNRVAFRPCLLVNGTVIIPHWQGSGDAIHMGCTNGLAQLPPTNNELETGKNVLCLPYPWTN